jgi:hypothetical protein
MRTWFLLVVATLGCSAARVSGESAAEQDRSAALALDQHADELSSSLFASAAEANPPECGRTCALAEQICDLGERICGISARHSEERDLSNRCIAATARCTRARTRVWANCDCARR